jgi:tetratricopeptide (TPR) repeat protein
VEKDPTIYSATNNLALSYFFDGRKHKAIEMSKKVLEAQPQNLHAICNLALFYSDMSDQERAAAYLEKIVGIGDIQPEDMHKIALTYCELGYHDKAYRWFLKIVSYQPYDIRILHFCGLAAYNCGLYAEALGFFVKILKIDPQNSLALYYSVRAQDAKKNGGGKEFEYVYQVQFDEIKRRISYLNECLKQKNGSLESKWKYDKHFRSIIYWGLHYGDEYIKKIVLEIMSMFTDAEVEEEFRNFLLKSAETDEIKNDIFMYLKRMGAREPYVAYIKGAIAEVRVGTVSEDIKGLPAPFAEALNTFIKNAKTRYDDDFVSTGVELLVSIVSERNDSGAWVARPSALAAALELCVSELMDYKRPPLKKELVKIYGVSLITLNKYYRILFEDPDTGENDAD